MGDGIWASREAVAVGFYVQGAIGEDGGGLSPLSHFFYMILITV